LKGHWLYDIVAFMFSSYFMVVDACCSSQLVVGADLLSCWRTSSLANLQELDLLDCVSMRARWAVHVVCVYLGSFMFLALFFYPLLTVSVILVRVDVYFSVALLGRFVCLLIFVFSFILIYFSVA